MNYKMVCRTNEPVRG